MSSRLEDYEPLFNDSIQVRINDFIDLGWECVGLKELLDEGELSQEEFDSQSQPLVIAARKLLEECLLDVRDERNYWYVDHLIEDVVPHLGPKKLCAFVIGLCPTPRNMAMKVWVAKGDEYQRISTSVVSPLVSQWSYSDQTPCQRSRKVALILLEL